jgi:uncharacterized repeat protein (TIGR02543 family)
MSEKIKISSKKKKSLLSLALIVALLTMVFLPAQTNATTPITDTPVGVDGRILPAIMAGDTSNWVEIARNGEYSLIVRTNYINWYPNNRGNPEWQYTPYGATNTYTNSKVCAIINAWFNGIAASTADNLPADARLRNYAMQTNAINVVGTCNTANSMTNGYSKPTVYQVGVGNDIAFALSYSEAANFLSKTHDIRAMNPQIQPSGTVANTNYAKISIPQTHCYGMWLRSPGDLSNTAGDLDYTGRVFQLQINPNGYSEKGLVYPALWVNSAIFETAPTSYNINYALNGGVNAPSNPASYTTSALPLSIANPSKPGYEFLRWTLISANGSSVTLPLAGIPAGTTGDVTLAAIWGAPIQYAITYNLNGGAPASGNPTTYNVENSFTINANTVAAPTMTGYRFVNWMAIYGNGTMFNLTPAGIPAGSTGNVLLSAIWDPTPISFNIVYMLDGGTNAPGNPTAYTVASNFPVSITNPTKPGYTFLGWVVVYNNGTLIPLTPSYSIPAGSAGEVTLNAIWTPIIQQQYSINYVLTDGVTFSSTPPTSYTASTLPLSIPIPSRPGYVFSHWIIKYANGVETVLQNGVIPAGTTGAVTLTAIWTTAPTYSISYSLNGGVNAPSNPTSYSAGNISPISIAAPSMTSYTFVYWIALYENGSAIVLPPSGIPIGSTGNITLIAVWYP